MARRKRKGGAAKAKPGRETSKRLTKAQKRKYAASQYEYEKLVADRVSFLNDTSPRTIPPTTKREAERFITEQAREGVKYELQSKVVNGVRRYRAKFVDVSARRVNQSAGFSQIIQDLKSKGSGPRSRKARALAQLGRRDLSWTFAVGETNNP